MYWMSPIGLHPHNTKQLLSTLHDWNLTTTHCCWWTWSTIGVQITSWKWVPILEMGRWSSHNRQLQRDCLRKLSHGSIPLRWSTCLHPNHTSPTLNLVEVPPSLGTILTTFNVTLRSVYSLSLRVYRDLGVDVGDGSIAPYLQGAMDGCP